MTKIPIMVLRDFETDGLQTHDQLNGIYRQSLISAYASAVGVDTDLARRSISSTADGSYDGMLAKTYLSWSPQSSDEPADTSDPEDSARKGRSRILGRRSLSSISSTRRVGLDARIVALLFSLIAIAVLIAWATGSP